MEESLRGNVPLPDQKKKNSELTRSNSDSSGLTLDDANARPHGTSAVWTDEKHGLYLASLEASFVNNQLHHSIRLRGWLGEMGGRPCSSPHQFMVLRDSMDWQEVQNNTLCAAYVIRIILAAL
ncbi:hypothetical protein BDE02_09G088700 [Populus trichocarpa]|nr:hypothetical protein BDE02_09G088700 [Populus trichocarpa]KAI5577064.1 hypothetical protein BDE02_09G088700 [Populus trichocarpa]